MSRTSIRRALACATLLASVAAGASAQSSGTNRTVVNDGHRNIVTNSFGNCVRTRWMEGSDACAPQAEQQVAQRTVATPVRPSTEERQVYFEFDASDLDADARARLDNLARQLKSGEVRDIKIVGYADPMGTDEYNKALSNRRAKAVQAYLSERGVNTQVGELAALGETNRFAGCGDIKERDLRINCLRPNRRVEVNVDYYDAADARPIETQRRY